MKVKTLSKAVLAGSVMAGMAQVAMAAPTLGEVLDASGIAVNGYVEAGYTQFLGDSANFRVFDGDYAGTTAGRDANVSSFNLNQAAITIAKQPKEGAGAVVNLTAGEDADKISSNGSFGGGSTAAGDKFAGDNFDVTQAFLQYAAPGYSVMAGKFVTMAGAEVIAPTGNSNISRSILFGYAIPFTHTGFRVQLPLSDSLNVFAGVNNGWDQLSEADASGKTSELGATFSAGMLSGAVVAYIGDEPVGATTGRRDLVDAVVTLKLSDALSVVLNADYGRQERTSGNGTSSEWQGVAGYVNFQASEAMRLSVRGELFEDNDGYRTGVAQDLKELTATVGYAVDKNFEVAAEVRQDMSNKDVFLDGDGKADDTQTSLALRGLYKF